MILIKTKKEIAKMAEGGKILAEIMQQLKEMAKPGVTTLDLEKRAQALVLNYKAEPAFLNYKNGEKAKSFPCALCASLNNVIVHGLPSDYVLRNGDVLGLDLGIKYKGFYADMAISVGVGEIDFETLRFLKAIKKSLKLGIKKCRVGNTFGDVSNTIQRFIEYQGYSVIRSLCGHGIGRVLHEEPQIANFGKRKSGEEIKEGMVFCLEPMAARGDYKLKQSANGFGWETVDGSLTCHFEQTIAIIDGKPKILTRS